MANSSVSDQNHDFTDAQNWFNHGCDLYALEQYEKAIAAFDKVIEFDSEHFEAWFNRAAILHRLERYEEAIVALEKAVSLNKNDPIAWANLGWALGEWGRYPEAIAAYDNAIQIKPDFTPAIESRQQLLEK